MLIWWYMFALRDVPFLRIEIPSQSCLRRGKRISVTFTNRGGVFRFCLHLFLFLFLYSITFRVLTAAAARELFRNIKLLGQFCFGAFFVWFSPIRLSYLPYATTIIFFAKQVCIRK